MASKAAAAAAPEDTVLHLTRTFDTPRERVFRAWTDPDRLSKWWGPQTHTCPVAELDVRAGGKWRTCMLGEDGTERWVQGVYREVEAPERLVFTLAWETDGIPGDETLVTIEFRERAGGTEMVLTHERFATAESRDLHKMGWTSSFEDLADHLSRED
ncbi:MAG: SRPBCC domain-containing protein [Pseudomonadota bacterium]